MIPGPTIINACPSCDALFSQESMMSGNSFGARSWSDGYMDAPMMSDEPSAAKCRGCNTIFWISDARYVDSIWYSKREYIDRWKDADIPSAGWLSTEDIQNFLDRNTHAKDKEIYLRYRLWWGMNHARRYDRPSVAYTWDWSSYNANLRRLLDLLPDVDKKSLRSRCEILRELGRFEEAEQLASEHMREYDPHLRRIIGKCRGKDAELFEHPRTRTYLIAEMYVAGFGRNGIVAKQRFSGISVDTEIVLRKRRTMKGIVVMVKTADGTLLGILSGEDKILKRIIERMKEGMRMSAEIVYIDPKEENGRKIKIAITGKWLSDSNTTWSNFPGKIKGLYYKCANGIRGFLHDRKVDDTIMNRNTSRG